MMLKRLIVLTGLSGSGKSSAARALEDEGFFVVDNLPLGLLPEFLKLAGRESRFATELAVVIDVRNREFLTGVEDTLEKVKALGISPEIFFFEATDEALVRRYSETRRRHPLAQTEGLEEGIRAERSLLAKLRQLATVIVDSSTFTPHNLRERVVCIVRGEAGSSPLVVQVQSFGFRYGIPPGSDLVMDVRFLPNPHFIPQLQPLTGLDPAVGQYVLAQEACRDFLRLFKDLLQFLLPQYRREGKSYLTISIGCTGGRHRSVTIVEALRPILQIEGITVKVTHRDKDKE